MVKIISSFANKAAPRHLWRISPRACARITRRFSSFLSAFLLLVLLSTISQALHHCRTRFCVISLSAAASAWLVAHCATLLHLTHMPHHTHWFLGSWFAFWTVRSLRSGSWISSAFWVCSSLRRLLPLTGFLHASPFPVLTCGFSVKKNSLACSAFIFLCSGFSRVLWFSAVLSLVGLSSRGSGFWFLRSPALDPAFSTALCTHTAHVRW